MVRCIGQKRWHFQDTVKKTFTTEYSFFEHTNLISKLNYGLHLSIVDFMRLWLIPKLLHCIGPSTWVWSHNWYFFFWIFWINGSAEKVYPIYSNFKCKCKKKLENELMMLLDDICSRGASLFSSVFAIRGSSWEPVAFGRVLRRISLYYVPWVVGSLVFFYRNINIKMLPWSRHTSLDPWLWRPQEGSTWTPSLHLT